MYIGAIQATAIASLGYLYTGELISKSGAVAAVGIFISENIGLGLFLLVKSFLPPTGILDVAAATIALTITAAMLAAVARIYSLGYTLDDKDKMISIFKDIKEIVTQDIKNANKEDLLKKSFFSELIRKVLVGT